MSNAHFSAELAARRTVAAAVLADFKRETDAYIDDPANSTPRPDYNAWAWRLASELRSVLQRLDDEGSGPEPDPAAGQLAQVRLVLGAFDWETDDRQYALEQIDEIVNGDGR